MSDKFVSLHFGALELEPMDGASGPAPKGRAAFTPNTRSANRRVAGDRREQARLGDPRRAADDRRAKTGWDKAKP